MKTAALLTIALLWAGITCAQSLPPSRSVWIEDYADDSLPAVVASGKTTLIFGIGSSTAVANHVAVARYVARRVAEELATALVLPIRPTGVASNDLPGRESPMDAFEIVNRTIRYGGFRYVVIIADEGAGPEDQSADEITQRLEAQWRNSGVRIIPVTAHEERPGQGMTLNADYLRRWASRTVLPERRKAVEDQAELLYADPQQKWFRPDMIAAEDRTVVVPALGRLLLEQRVSSILNQIRSVSPAHIR